MVLQSCSSEILVEGSTELYANTKKLIMELFIPRDYLDILHKKFAKIQIL